MTTASIELFYSYAHEDEGLRGRLETHLAALQHQGVITGWHDRKLAAGTRWANEINTHLNQAAIILMLVSADFLASDYCYSIEMQKAMEREARGEARVIPIILRPAMWLHTPLGRLQALPQDLKPVTKWDDPEDAFLNIAEGIRAAAEEIRTKVAEHTDIVSDALAPQPAEPAKRVFLSYKRDAQPDEQVLEMLKQRLMAQKYEVLIDRHLNIGVEWFEEIERQIRTSDAVIPLLSSASVSSEMLTYEVQLAHKTAQQNLGVPRLLPVRINYDGPLSKPLMATLGTKQYALWCGPQDDEMLVTKIINALTAPPADPPRLPGRPGGAIPLDARYYIMRGTDDDFRDAIAQKDFIVMVKGARQMGKTSLLARGLQWARESGAQVALTDLQALNTSDLESAEKFYLRLGTMLAQEIGIDVTPKKMWDPDLGANDNFETFLRRHVLGKIEGRLVWGLDEVDRLFTCSFGNDVFSLFRTWFNARATKPELPWPRLTLAIVYATEPHLFITDPNVSPFNVGTRFELEDFAPALVADFNRRYAPPPPLRSEGELKQLYDLVGGHPYLVHQGLHHMHERQMDWAEFQTIAAQDEGPFSEHLRRLFVMLTRDAGLCEVVKGLLEDPPRQPATLEGFYRLRSSGVISGKSQRDARMRCQLYASYLKDHLFS